MKMILWDTRRRDFDAALRPSSGIWNLLSPQGTNRAKTASDSITEEYSWLASALRRSRVAFEFVYDFAPTADAYLFVPKPESLNIECDMIRSLCKARPDTPVFLFGKFAVNYASQFENTGAKVIRHAPAELAWCSENRTFLQRHHSIHTRDNFGDWIFLKEQVRQRLHKRPLCRMNLDSRISPEVLFDRVEHCHQVYGLREFEFSGLPLNHCPKWASDFLSLTQQFSSAVRWQTRFQYDREIELQNWQPKNLANAVVEIDGMPNFEEAVYLAQEISHLAFFEPAIEMSIERLLSDWRMIARLLLKSHLPVFNLKISGIPFPGTGSLNESRDFYTSEFRLSRKAICRFHRWISYQAHRDIRPLGKPNRAA